MANILKKTLGNYCIFKQ